MPVAYQSSTSATGAGTSTGGLAKPAGTAIGDVLVAQIFARTNGSVGALSINSTGDIWTLVHNNANSDFEFYVWVCVVANASSAISISWGGFITNYGVSIHRFTSVDTSAPQDVTATKSTGTGSAESSAGLASGTAQRHLVLCTGNSGGVPRASWSSPLTERVDTSYVAMASGTDTAGTDTGSKSNSVSGSPEWCAVLLALRAQLFLAQATPSITLSLAPAGLKIAPVTTTPGITLSLATAASVTLFAASAAPSIRLSMLAGVYPMAQASPRITLSLAPTVQGSLAAMAAPSITLGVTATAQIGHAAHATPAIRLAFEVHAIGGYVLAGGTVIELEYNA